MSWVLKRLVILGIILIAGGIWSGLQVGKDRGDNRSHHRDTRSPGAQPTREFWARPETLADHFARHGADFQARDAADYARQASAHLQRAYTAGLPAKRDPQGVVRVFDPRTGAFGAYNSDGTTRTYFKTGDPSYFDRQPGDRVNLYRPLRL